MFVHKAKRYVFTGEGSDAVVVRSIALRKGTLAPLPRNPPRLFFPKTPLCHPPCKILTLTLRITSAITTLKRYSMRVGTPQEHRVQRAPPAKGPQRRKLEPDIKLRQVNSIALEFVNMLR
jgi:hypothetical protein